MLRHVFRAKTFLSKAILIWTTAPEFFQSIGFPRMSPKLIRIRLGWCIFCSALLADPTFPDRLSHSGPLNLVVFASRISREPLPEKSADDRFGPVDGKKCSFQAQFLEIITSRLSISPDPRRAICICAQIIPQFEKNYRSVTSFR